LSSEKSCFTAYEKGDLAQAQPEVGHGLFT
jgi:hypothetical protein